MRSYKKAFYGTALFMLLGALYSSNAQAISFQSTQPVKFTFNSTISLSVSDDLAITNLAPGGAAESNIIDIDVTTNTVMGYYLTATAGTSSTSTDLVSTTNSEHTFSSLDVDDSIESIDDADGGKWGYSFAIDNVFSNFSGLPLDNDDDGDTGASLVDTNIPANTSVYRFKIGAKASNGQPSGTYTNVINFYLVSKIVPDEPSISDLEYMQEFARLDSGAKAAVISSMTLNEQYQLKDERDEKTYYIARLADGNVWMTQNLDLDLDSNRTYTPYDTDIPTYWTPVASTETELVGFPYPIRKSTSFDLGSLCWDGDAEYKGDNNSRAEELRNFELHTYECSQSDNHYHIGNYYNWTASVATDYITDIATPTNPTYIDQSICPAGWKLPTDRNYTSLINSLNLTVDVHGGSVIQNPVYFTLSGHILLSMMSDTPWATILFKDSTYWTSTALPGYEEYDRPVFFFAYHLNGHIGVDWISFNGDPENRPIRCIAR